jgi:hypothetical protein
VADPTDILAVDHELETVLTAPGVHRTVSGTHRVGGTYLSTTIWRPASTTRLYLVPTQSGLDVPGPGQLCCRLRPRDVGHHPIPDAGCAVLFLALAGGAIGGLLAT